MGNEKENEMANETVMVHKFEAAGLGLAPFRVVGVFEKRGPIKVGERDGVTTWLGGPGQPMGTCDFCGTGIAECWVIRSSDGREFIVGCDCVRKTDDAGLVKQLAPKLKELRRQKAADLADRKARELEEILLDPANRARLDALPHSRGWSGHTFLTECEWMACNAGAKGRAAILKAIKARLGGAS